MKAWAAKARPTHPNNFGVIIPELLKKSYTDVVTVRLSWVVKVSAAGRCDAKCAERMIVAYGKVLADSFEEVETELRLKHFETRRSRVVCSSRGRSLCFWVFSSTIIAMDTSSVRAPLHMDMRWTARRRAFGLVGLGW